jgi:tetratricopeptide (TPR) repeat protein
MKYIPLLFVVFFMACNNSDNTATKIDTTINRELQLINDTKNYPDSSILTENLIEYYKDNEDYNKALAVVDSAINKQGNNARWWDIKGTLDLENGDTTAATKSFEKAVSIYPYTKYLIHLGIVYAQTKNNNALIIADTLLANNNTDIYKDANFIKGLYYSYSNQKLKSIPYFDSCLAISYTYMDAYIEKALALYDLGKYEDALAVLDKAVTVQNSFDVAYYYRGRCLEKLNRPLQAIEAYHMALIYDPDYTDAKDALSKLEVKVK